MSAALEALLVPGARHGEPPRPPRRHALAAAVLALHAAGAWLLIQAAPARELTSAPANLRVNLIAEAPAAPAPVPPRAPAPPMQPLPAPTLVPVPMVVLDAPPAPAPAPAQPPTPQPARVAPPALESAPVLATAHPAPSAATPPAPPSPRTVDVSTVRFSVPLAPVYPRASRRLREHGLVEVRVLVDAQGVPQEVRLARSSGFERLDEAALVALRAARFVPYAENGVSQPFWVVIPVDFAVSG